MVVTFDDIPNELQHYVFLHLDESDLANFSCTCRRWNSLVQDEHLWRALVRIRFGSMNKKSIHSWKLHYKLQRSIYRNFVAKSMSYWKSRRYSYSKVENTDLFTDECFWAAENGFVSILARALEFLFCAGQLIDLTNGRISLLGSACKEGQLEVVKYLISKGASTSIRTIDGRTPIYLAAQHGHANVLEYLLTFPHDIEAASMNETTPLYIACKNNHLECVKILLQHGAKIDVEVTLHGLVTTPILIAAASGYASIVKILKEYGADIQKEIRLVNSRLLEELRPFNMRKPFAQAEKECLQLLNDPDHPLVEKVEKIPIRVPVQPRRQQCIIC